MQQLIARLKQNPQSAFDQPLQYQPLIKTLHTLEEENCDIEFKSKLKGTGETQVFIYDQQKKIRSAKNETTKLKFTGEKTIGENVFYAYFSRYLNFLPFLIYFHYIITMISATIKLLKVVGTGMHTNSQFQVLIIREEKI